MPRRWRRWRRCREWPTKQKSPRLGPFANRGLSPAAALPYIAAMLPDDELKRLRWLAADLARAAHGKGARAVVIAADEAAMRALADTVPLFAPEVEVITLPAWDCLPYDRASPALRVMAERLATFNSFQAKPNGPQLLIATANAASQSV